MITFYAIISGISFGASIGLAFRAGVFGSWLIAAASAATFSIGFVMLGKAFDEAFDELRNKR